MTLHLIFNTLLLSKASTAGSRVAVRLATHPLPSDTRTTLHRPGAKYVGGETMVVKGQIGDGDWTRAESLKPG